MTDTGSRRCSLCGLDWPLMLAYFKCPLCGDQTSALTNGTPMSVATATELVAAERQREAVDAKREAQHLRAQADFEEYYVERIMSSLDDEWSRFGSV